MSEFWPDHIVTRERGKFLTFRIETKSHFFQGVALGFYVESRKNSFSQWAKKHGLKKRGNTRDVRTQDVLHHRDLFTPVVSLRMPHFADFIAGCDQLGIEVASFEDYIFVPKFRDDDERLAFKLRFA